MYIRVVTRENHVQIFRLIAVSHPIDDMLINSAYHTAVTVRLMRRGLSLLPPPTCPAPRARSHHARGGSQVQLGSASVRQSVGAAGCRRPLAMAMSLRAYATRYCRSIGARESAGASCHHRAALRAYLALRSAPAEAARE